MTPSFATSALPLALVEKSNVANQQHGADQTEDRFLLLWSDANHVHGVLRTIIRTVIVSAQRTPHASTYHGLCKLRYIVLAWDVEALALLQVVVLGGRFQRQFLCSVTQNASAQPTAVAR